LVLFYLIAYFYQINKTRDEVQILGWLKLDLLDLVLHDFDRLDIQLVMNIFSHFDEDYEE
jgi:hypothetical protein